MAYLIRPWTYRYIKDGKRVPKETPGAKRKKERARKWYAAGLSNWPKGKKVPLASDKSVAQQMLSELVRNEERGEVGLQDSTTEARKKLLAHHLNDFETSLRNRLKPPGDEQIKLLLARIGKAFTGCQFTYPDDIKPEPILAYLAERRRLTKDEGGISTQTANFYLSAVNQFCRWMRHAKPKRMIENPLEGIELGDVKLDRQHDRRDLKPAELLRLFEAAKASPKFYKRIGGMDRYMIYHTACGTGLRSGELGTLTPESFRLDAEPPAVTLGAAHTKNKKAVTQPLPSGLAVELKGYLSHKKAGKPIWPGLWCVRAADMLKIDLEAAGIPYIVNGPDGPLYADFHALRHTYVTMVQENATPKTAQVLARHSDARLTIGRYSHSDMAARAAAVNQLPLPGNDQACEMPSVEQLTAAVVLLATILDTLLVVAMVVPDSEANGNREEQRETETAEQERNQTLPLVP